MERPLLRAYTVRAPFSAHGVPPTDMISIFNYKHHYNSVN
ncbi:hypothetical protein HMPREF0083_03479 [Aneurinibacillus aneurinilyticus ATCC 12856]|uniref:Uncharacterized protein n=1 Tax=Aneurinibacillus aneurinilyticus ATCC 12856 TaxID=649747 RepID=U1Y8G2_ANEAE|nr:hypothetical protein HMPREF0083_03479 [Aneurinibacillus aneurinilyticus ATCC 12856]